MAWQRLDATAARSYCKSLSGNPDPVDPYCFEKHKKSVGGTLTCLDTRQGRAQPTLPLIHRPSFATRTDSSLPLPSLGTMSHSHLTTTSSSSSSPNFRPIFNDALKAYKKRTKKDILIHPLASQLEACNSPADILAVLHQQVQGLDQSPNGDDRWTKWLGPTVNVLCTLSDILGEGVGLVSFRK